MRRAIVGVVRGLGYTVIEAGGTVEVRRLATTGRKIDLLFVDVSPPENNGLELIRWFQTMFPRTKVLITADSLWELLYQSGKPDQFGALAKPFTNLELQNILRKILN